jgi:virulence-associated protein VapD
MEQIEIQTIEPPKLIKTFENKEAFEHYYSKNKEAMDKMTAHKLNKTYQVEGYHIGRKKGIEGIVLKKWQGSRYVKDSQLEKFNQTLSLLDRFEEFKQEVEDMIEQMNVQIHNDVIKQIESKIITKCSELIETKTNDLKKIPMLIKAHESLCKEFDEFKASLRF